MPEVIAEKPAEQAEPIETLETPEIKSKKPKKNRSRKKFKLKKRWIVLGVIALGIAYVAMQLSALSGMPRMLQSTVAEVRPIETYIATSGRIAHGELTEYYVGASTAVDRVYFSEGDLVSRGDLIIAFDHTDVLTALQQSEIAYEKARLSIRDSEITYFNAIDELADLRYDLKEAKAQRDRYQDNYNKGGDAADRERWERYFDMVESYENQIKAKELTIPTDEALQILVLSLEEAKLDYETARRAAENLPANIVAPFDGVIEHIGLTSYGPAAKGTLAVSVRNTDNDIVVFNVGRYDFPYIEIGQEAAIRVGRNSYEGVVSKIGSVALEEDNTVEIEVRVADRDAYFISGLEADLDVLIYESEQYITLPIESVKSDREGRYCYVLEPHPDTELEGIYIPVVRRIEAGRSSDSDIEVTEGLAAGEIVVQTIPTDIDYIAQAIPLMA